MLCICGLAATTASAQSFNLDSDTGVAGNTAMGAPSATFGGAAAQPGTWNVISGITTLSIPLLKLDGSASGATFTRQSAAGGNFAFDNTNTSGDFQLLLDDGYDLSALPTGFVTFTFSGLQNGTYDVYTYAVAPDFPPDITTVRIGTDTSTAQDCGGTIPVGSFTQGVTHTKHTVVVTNGTIEIQADGKTAADFGTINGIQLKLIPAVACPADINGDHTVNVADLLTVISSWGACANCAACPADIAPAVHDCNVNVADLLAVISSWGACP
jgi:hypothetical protein